MFPWVEFDHGLQVNSAEQCRSFAAERTSKSVDKFCEGVTDVR